MDSLQRCIWGPEAEGQRGVLGDGEARKTEGEGCTLHCHRGLLGEEGAAKEGTGAQGDPPKAKGQSLHQNQGQLPQGERTQT